MDLYELALDLRRVPVDASTRALHLRALELKREVGRWPEHPPDDSSAQSVLRELAQLRAEALAWRTTLSQSARGCSTHSAA